MTPLRKAIDTILLERAKLFGGQFRISSYNYDYMEDTLSVSLKPQVENPTQHMLFLYVFPLPVAYGLSASHYRIEVNYDLNDWVRLKVPARYVLDFLLHAKLVYPTASEPFQLYYGEL